MPYVVVYNSKETEKYEEALSVFEALKTLYIQTSSELGELLSENIFKIFVILEPILSEMNEKSI